MRNVNLITTALAGLAVVVAVAVGSVTTTTVHRHHRIEANGYDTSPGAVQTVH